MSALADVQGLLRRLAEAAPGAWRQDRVFRWAAVGAGVTLGLFVLRLVNPAAPVNTPQQAPSSPASLGDTYGTSVAPPASPPSPAVPSVVPKIAPGRSLDSVSITPAAHGDGFGTIKPKAR